MASLQIFVMVAVIACGVAIPILEIPHFPHLEHKEIVLHEPIHHHIEHHPKYEFKYGVHDSHTHDIKEHQEKRDGDRVEGYYKLQEPDGTTRTVKYTADKHSGFRAQVIKSGHAKHPSKKVVIPVKKISLPHEYDFQSSFDGFSGLSGLSSF